MITEYDPLEFRWMDPRARHRGRQALGSYEAEGSAAETCLEISAAHGVQTTPEPPPETSLVAQITAAYMRSGDLAGLQPG